MPSRCATAVLWTAGVYEEFRLFNWIDRKALRADYELAPAGGGPAGKADGLFPHSPRSVILQSYLFGNYWIWVPPWREKALRGSIIARAAGRYCQGQRDLDRQTLTAVLRIVSPDDPASARSQRKRLASFACSGGRVQDLAIE